MPNNISKTCALGTCTIAGIDEVALAASILLRVAPRGQELAALFRCFSPNDVFYVDNVVLIGSDVQTPRG